MQFKPWHINPKKNFGTSTGFKPVASAMLCVSVAMLYHLSNELTNTLRAGEFVEFVFKPVKGMKHEDDVNCGNTNVLTFV